MKILLITYYFPPLQGGGIQRLKQIHKYLPGMGHETVVLTHTYSSSEYAGDREIRVYDPSHNRNRKGWRALQWMLMRLWVEAVNRLGGYRSIYTWWKKRVFRALPELIAEFRPDIAIVSYPPAEVLEIGIHFREKFGIPWIADMRDGLLFEPIEERSLNVYRSVRDHYQLLEKRIFQSAYAFMAANPGLFEYIRGHCGHERVLLFPNSFDPEDFADLTAMPRPDGEFLLVHTGNAALSDSTCDITPFCRAMEMLVDHHPEIDGRWRALFIGNMTRNEQEMIKNLQRKRIAHWQPSLPRREALRWMKSADILLLFTSASRIHNTPGKLFEYLASGKPILAMTGDTFAARIITETKSGWCVPPADFDSIAALLWRIASNPDWRKEWTPDRKKIQEHTVGQRMKTLAEFLSHRKPLQ